MSALFGHVKGAAASESPSRWWTKRSRHRKTKDLLQFFRQCWNSPGLVRTERKSADYGYAYHADLGTRSGALRSVIEARRDEGQALHHLPDPVARAFVDANVYRLLLPVEYGGENLDSLG